MGEEKAQVPFGEMFALWQKMMWEGFEMMLKGPAFAAGLGKAFENVPAFHEQLQKNIQASLKAMNLPTTEDLHRIAEGISAMRVQIEAMRGYLDGVERVVTLQEKWRKGVDETIQRLFARQEEGQKSFQAWTKTVEDRFNDLQRFWEEGTRRWAEGLTEAVTLWQGSHRSLEEMGKAVSDISKSVFRQGPATHEEKEIPSKPSQRKVKGPPAT
jgi:hypothetical protein